MGVKILYTLLLILVIAVALNTQDIKIILYGVALFLIGMFFMETGFKKFTGGTFELLLEKMTNNRIKAVLTGITITGILQSSTLVSLMLLSFFKADIITLTQSIGVVFGTNVGTTLSSWLVATYGMKLNTAVLAIPLIIIGMFLRFSNDNKKGIGEVFVGISFLFLGIQEMKSGFTELQQTIDLTQYAITGYKGMFLYILIGIIVTITIPSSVAVMALIIAAIASNQIIMENAIAMIIGTNIGTTVTIMLGSIESNHQGKRMALAHFLFNFKMAIIACTLFVFIIPTLQYISPYLHIDKNNEVLQIVMFHTLFNLIGVILFLPFIKYFVKLVVYLIKPERQYIKPKYLDNSVLEVQTAATKAIAKEFKNLYKITRDLMLNALYLNKENVLSMKVEDDICLNIYDKKKVNVTTEHEKKILAVYGAIIKYSILIKEKINEKEQEKMDNVISRSRKLNDLIQDIKEIQQNIYKYRRNQIMSNEYNKIRSRIGKTLKEIEEIRKGKLTDIQLLEKIEKFELKIKKADEVNESKIKQNLEKLNNVEISILMTDLTLTKKVIRELLLITKTIWVEEEVLKTID